MLTLQHYIGFFLTLVVTAGVSIFSLRFVKTASDFSVGGRNLGPGLVAGYLVGSFVGGTSTVGTAQVAYSFGVSGIWFTLGAGISCLIMGLFLAKPMREAEVDTIPQFLGNNYGPQVITWASTYTTVGMFIQVIAQVLSAIPLLMSLVPVTEMQAAIFSTGLIAFYIFFGGFWGTSLVGIFKTFLIYGSLGVAGLYSISLLGGMGGLVKALPPFPWFSLFPSGISKELAAGFSVVVGVASTQTYMQALFAGKNVRASRIGVFFAAILIPVIGAASVMIGLFMRVNYPDINPALALPLFITTKLHPLFGGVVLAALLISLVMTGASLTLGVCTILSQDIYKKIFRPDASDVELLKVSRILILIVAGAILWLVTTNLNSMILKWAFLSMALRGVTVFIPLLGAVFFKRYISPKAGVGAVIIAPMVALTWPMWKPINIEPLYVGVFSSILILLSGNFITSSCKNKCSENS